MEDTDFVVYGFLRQCYSSFYYIGKGRPYRPHQKNKRTIPHPGNRSRVVILYQNLTEDRALEIEKKLISLMGRVGIDKGGVLRNIRSGGEGVSQKHSSKLKQKKYLYRHQKLLKNKKTWFHCVSGEVKDLTPKELSDKFPEQVLSGSGLSKVARRIKKSYKGWILSGSGNSPYIFKVFTHDWYHREYGEVIGVSCRDLVKKFRQQSLSISQLRTVSSGKSFSHRGWILLGNRWNKIKQDKGKRNDWYHEKHGVIKNKSTRYISDFFGVKYKKLLRVSAGKARSYMGWRLLVNKGLILRNDTKLVNWEHQEHGVIRNCSAGQLSKMFPSQGLITSSLRDLARGECKSHKGWSLEGNLVVKTPELFGNWYNPDYGVFFGKTPSEMSKVDDREVARPNLFSKMLNGNSKSLRGWVLLKKCPKAYKPVESKLVKTKKP